VFFACDSANASESDSRSRPNEGAFNVSATNPEITGRKSANTTTKANVEPLLVRPREAWRMLGCGNTRGYQLIASGELETFLDGSARKIVVASIHAFIARKLASSEKGETPEAPRRRQSSDTNQCREVRS
jgi:hypothetical protein